MNLFELYLLTRLGPLSTLLITGAVVSAVILVCMALAHIATEGGWWNWKLFKGGIVSLILFSTLSIVVPTNKQLAVIFAGHWATNSEQVEKLPDNVVRTMNSFMDKYNSNEGDDDE